MSQPLTTPQQYEEVLRMLEDVYELGGAYGVSDFTDRAILRTVARHRIQTNRTHGHTVSSVARAVGLPLETCRRRVRGLIDKGYVVRAASGLDLPEPMRGILRDHINSVYAVLHRTVTNIENDR